MIFAVWFYALVYHNFNPYHYLIICTFLSSLYLPVFYFIGQFFFMSIA